MECIGLEGQQGQLRRRLTGWLAATVGGVVIHVMAWPALAQEGEGAGEAGAEGAGQLTGGAPTVAELFMTNPWVNGLLLILSILAVGLFLHLLLTLTSRSFRPSQFIDDVTRMIHNQQFDRAIHYCQNQRGVFAAGIVQRIIENRDKGPAVLMSILDTEGRRRTDRIWNRVGYLAEIAAIAPTLGLLGTVIGMIKVFFTLVENVAAPENVRSLSAGIAEAMGTTMFGLIVALLAGICYTIVRGRATHVLVETEHACHSVVDHLHHATGSTTTSVSPEPAHGSIS